MTIMNGFLEIIITLKVIKEKYCRSEPNIEKI